AAANVLYATGGSTGCATAPCYAQAIAAAQAYTAANYPAVSASDWSTCTDPGHYFVPTGGSQCISFGDSTGASSVQPTVVRVATPTVVHQTFFAGLLGVNKLPIATVAEATLTPGAQAVCGLCVLGTGTHDIQNGDITLDGASAYFNGNVS